MRKVISKDIQDNADTYIGRTGEIWISEDNTQLRVGDDTTPGGVEIGVGSASSLVNGNASVTVSPDGVVTFPDGGALTIPNPIVPDVVFDTPGTYQWTCPPGVTSVSVVCVGGGAGGSDSIGDGSQGGGDSWFISPSLVAGLGAPGYTGPQGGIGGGYVGDGGGNGGRSGTNPMQNYPVGGGGAGGYVGDGGQGANVDSPGTAGDGGAGGGGGGSYENTGGGGGGVGLYGIGQSGAAGSFTSNYTYVNFFGSGGGGGSGGQAGGPSGQDYGSAGGLYGGGGGSGIDYYEGGGGGGLGWKNNIPVTPGQTYTVQVGAGGAAYNTNNGNAGNGGHGAVRIIWGGSGNEDFSFPYNAGYNLTIDQNGITLPFGATISTNIVEPNNIGPTAAIDIRPYSIDPNQLLRIYSTVNEGNHIHLTSGNLKVTDIYLGDDNQYVRTGADGNVAVGTNGGEVWNGNTWIFGKDGSAYFPGIKIGSTVDSYSVAIGYEASSNPIGVAIGRRAGNTEQGEGGIAIGPEAGNVHQGNSSIAVGWTAGQTNQGDIAIAIGDSAGYINQGVASIALGAGAGQNNQAPNSIVINATGSNIENTVPNTVVIKPMRSVNITTGFYQVYYNPTTGEMVYYQP